MNEPLSRYSVTVTVACDGGSGPGPATFAAAAGRAAWRRPASIISAHLAGRIISVVTVTAPGRHAAVTAARAVVSDALNPPGPVTWPLSRRPCPASFRPRGLTGSSQVPTGSRLAGACAGDYGYSGTVAADQALDAPWRPRPAHRYEDDDAPGRAVQLTCAAPPA